MYEPHERRSLTRFLVPLGAIAVAVLIVIGAVLALGLLGDDADREDDTAVAEEPTPEPTSTPVMSPEEQTLGTFVEQSLSQTYIGDCSQATPDAPAATPAPGETVVPQPAGGLCSQARGERDGTHAFVLGRPLTDPTHWAFLRENGGAWQVVHSLEITADTRSVSGVPWPLQAGVEVVVVGGDCLNVREGPALEQAAVDCIPDGARLTLGSGPVEADGFSWWQVEGRAGWVVSDYLRFAE